MLYMSWKLAVSTNKLFLSIYLPSWVRDGIYYYILITRAFPHLKKASYVSQPRNSPVLYSIFCQNFISWNLPYCLECVHVLYIGVIHRDQLLLWINNNQVVAYKATIYREVSRVRWQFSHNKPGPGFNPFFPFKGQLWPEGLQRLVSKTL
jgi:hypothetical protein